VMPGPELSEVEWKACLEVLAALETAPAYICASGSLPPGAPDDLYARVADIAATLGARLVLDTSGQALRAALDRGVYLIKPNLREMCELTGSSHYEQPAMIAACRTLIDRGAAEIIALTLGAEGALLVSRDRAWRAAPMAVKAVSTVGAGDSFLGAMVWALATGKPLDEAFRYGMAGGSAALLAPGTALCRAEDVRRLLDEVIIEDLSGQASA